MKLYYQFLKGRRYIFRGKILNQKCSLPFIVSCIIRKLYQIVFLIKKEKRLSKPRAAIGA